jgi:hypothetical protein
LVPQEESERFDGVGKLILQLQQATLNGQVGSNRSQILKDLKEKAGILRSTLLDHMWKEDTVLLPLIVQSFSAQDVSKLIQNIMAIRPTETVQTIVQLMATKHQKDTERLAAGPKIPTPRKHQSNQVQPSPTVDAAASGTASLASLQANPYKAPTLFKRWGVEDDILLRLSVTEHNGKNWKKIADGVPGRTGVQCYQRWQRLKPGMIKGNFTQDEDRMLLTMAGVHAPNKNWQEIALRLPGRTGKQCRDRWCNVLDPSLKRSKWTEEEDGVVLEAFQRLGNSWAAIQQLLPGRTQLQVRDRLRTLVGKSANQSPTHHPSYRDGNSQGGLHPGWNGVGVDHLGPRLFGAVGSSSPAHQVGAAGAGSASCSIASETGHNMYMSQLMPHLMNTAVNGVAHRAPNENPNRGGQPGASGLDAAHMLSVQLVPQDLHSNAVLYK